MNRSIYILLLALSFQSKSTLAQSTSHFYLADLVSDYVTQLRNKGVDTVCIYKAYSFGDGFILPKEADSCNYQNVYVPTYITWQSKGKTFLTKKDNCFDYSVIKIPSPDFWSIYFVNLEVIKAEKFKPFEYRHYDKTEKKNVISDLSYDHSRNRDCKVIIGSDTSAILVDMIIFQSQELENRKNLNYKYNNDLKSKMLIDSVSTLINNIERDRLLIKTRR